jgi:hypothetical protein
MTLDDLVCHCPRSRPLRRVIEQVVREENAKAGPLIIRYYTYDQRTHTLRDGVNGDILMVPPP